MLKYLKRHYEVILAAAVGVHLAVDFMYLVIDYVLKISLDDPIYLGITLAVTPIYIGSILLLYLLIFHSKLRDEYLDKLWQRAIRSFTYAIMALPWLWLLTWGFKALFFKEAHWLPADPNVPILVMSGDDPTSISQRQLDGVSFVLGMLWSYGPVLFVFLFKWHAWRDRD